MRDKKGKKNDSEIKITNYMDDFDEEYDDDENSENINNKNVDDDELNTENEDTENNKLDDENDEVINDDNESEQFISSDEDEDNDDIKLEDTKEFNLDDFKNHQTTDDEIEFSGNINDIEEDKDLRSRIKRDKENKPPKKKIKKRYRLKKSAYILLLIIVILIFAIVKIIDHIKYIHSNEYFLLEKGYTKEQVEQILTDEEITTLFLERDYNKDLLSFVTSKYYLKKNLDKYLNYKEKNENKSISDIIAIINTNANKDWYDDPNKTDITKDYLILVNKFYYLDDNYEVSDLVSMSVKYAFSGKQMRQEAYDNFINMATAAKKENLTIVANSTYRTYTQQVNTYNYYKNQKGIAYADSYAARPGHSEHQTGLAVDISTLDTTIDFETTNEFIWLKNNAYKYGFILRYPKEKEYLTGYGYEPWHYRYVGKDVAKQIYEENITFEEYYAFYIQGK